MLGKVGIEDYSNDLFTEQTEVLLGHVLGDVGRFYTVDFEELADVHVFKYRLIVV